jgi:hypothetical protein
MKGTFKLEKLFGLFIGHFRYLLYLLFISIIGYNAIQILWSVVFVLCILSQL